MNISYVDPEKITHKLLLVGRHHLPGFYRVTSHRRGDLSLNFGAILIDGKRATQEALDELLKKNDAAWNPKALTVADLENRIQMMRPEEVRHTLLKIAASLYVDEDGTVDFDREISGADAVDAVNQILESAGIKTQ